MDSLDDIFRKNAADKDMAHHGYSKHYEKLFEPLRDKPITILEIGVQYGCSIRSWLEYFPQGTVIGIDHQRQWEFRDPRFSFILMDQTNPELIDRVPEGLDIVIDDGSHIPIDQTASFDNLWPKIKPGGYYIIEDTHPNHDPKHDPMYHRGARELLWHIAGAINWFGKTYYGRPFALEIPAPYEREFESCTITRGLLVIRKSP